MNLSKFYARVIGLYLVIMSVGMFIRPQPLILLVSPGNSALFTTLGIFTLILGLAMVVSHQRWQGWPIIITILGYWATIKGIWLIFYPNYALNITNIVLQGANLKIGLGIDFILGLILLFLGLKSKT